MREAYVNAGKASVRVTMDRAVRLGPEFGGELAVQLDHGTEVYAGFVILELKFTELMPTWMMEMVRGFDLTSSGAAKYGMGVLLLGENRVKRRRTGFEWGSSITNSATSAPWLDASAALRDALGPNRR